MSVLIFLDQSEGHIKKSSFEAAAYGAKIAEQTGTEATGLVLGKVTDDLSALGKYGLKKVLSAADEKLNQFDDSVFAEVVAGISGNIGAKVIVLSNNFDGKALAPRLSVRLKAGLVQEL